MWSDSRLPASSFQVTSCLQHQHLRDSLFGAEQTQKIPGPYQALQGHRNAAEAAEAHMLHCHLAATDAFLSLCLSCPSRQMHIRPAEGGT